MVRVHHIKDNTSEIYPMQGLRSKRPILSCGSGGTVHEEILSGAFGSPYAFSVAKHSG